MYKKLTADFHEMTNLQKELREKLIATAYISAFNSPVISRDSGSETVKFLFTLEDGKRVETVLIVHDGRKTVCISTQVGCPVACLFCATGKMKECRNLTVSEIINQFIYIKKHFAPDLTNIVFMGMGEPFLNYENVIHAANLLNDQRGLRIGARRITISTAGIIRSLERYIQEEHGFKLAISLTGRNNELRNKLIPINQKYPLEDLLKVAKKFSATRKNKITFEWVLIHGLTDTDEDIAFLVKLHCQMSCKINLIPLNPVDNELARTPEKRIHEFFSALKQAGCQITIRNSPGDDIQAACGQLNAEIP
ncbi:MAG: 23S rRNA (adenine(2503)-C(2))-methyltransferase RlmN [Nitrospinae bacterium]|nr:23S rRNA (adenine(2503)-C(2))-methyltransferase RlmN [Nitrospinota bacterium]